MRLRPAWIRIRGETSAWRTPEGVGLGTTLAELDEMNDAGIDISGFGGEDGGTITGWRGGDLRHLVARKGRVVLRLSDSPPIGPHVVSILILFERSPGSHAP